MSGTEQLGLDRRAGIAAQLAVRARAYFDTFKFLESSVMRPLIVDAMEDFHWYFWHQHHTHRLAFIVEVAGLFKRQKGTINLPHLVDQVRSSMAETAWITLVAKLTAVEEVAAKAILLRNQAIAHRSATTEFEEVFAQANVTRDELETLSNAAIEIANGICDARNVSGAVPLSSEVERDMRRLFRKLGADIPLTDLEQVFGEG